MSDEGRTVDEMIHRFVAGLDVAEPITATYVPEQPPTGDLFRCGQYRPLRDASLYWTVDHKIDRERTVWATAVYCSGYCGRKAANLRIGT
jgi:hypothetical protein